MRRRAIVWFRQDLRISDNEALTEALNSVDEIIPVYVFDERQFLGKTSFGFRKTGKYRAKFMIESVLDLREQLRELGSDLYVRVGKPEEEIFDIAKKVKSSWIFCNRERTREEVQVQDALEQNLWTVGQEIRYSRGKLLYYTADLPFPITQTPDVFTQFRKEVERIIQVRDPLPSPTKEDIQPLTVAIATGDIPTLETLGYDFFEPDPRAVITHKGGETAGMDRLRYYFWETDLIKNYKDTRNNLIGGDFSTKFSAWLAQGCLSPKVIYQELKRYEEEKGGNKSTYWLFFELMWRDFFRLMAKKHVDRIFWKGGPKGQIDHSVDENYDLLHRWVAGRTGVPFVDANMREIACTGFMSNRGRQNVASFLVNDLKVNWQMGAEYFESMLIDYDVASNWGNWNYIAGVGSDPRDDRYFNILNQAKTYDPQGEYVKLWLPELADVPADKIHQPETLSIQEQDEFHVHIGDDYPESAIDTDKWAGASY